MSLKLIISFLLCFVLIGMAGGIAWDTGGSDSETSTTDSSVNTNANNEAENEEEAVDFSGEGLNLYSRDELRKFSDKMFVGGTDSFGNLPEGTFKVPSLNGWNENEKLKDAGWNQLANEFWADADCWETEADRTAYAAESDKVNAGEPTDLAIHAKQVGRFLQFCADFENEDGAWLPEGAMLIVPRGTIYMENSGQTYNIPVFGAISYKKEQTGQFWYPSLEEGEEKFKNDLVDAPMEIDPSADVIGWGTAVKAET